MSYANATTRTLGDVTMTVLAWTVCIATAILAGTVVFSL